MGCTGSHKILLVTPNIPRVFQVTKHIPEKASENYCCPTVGRKRVQEQDSHQLATDRKEQERERNMWRLVIIGCGPRLRRVGYGCVKKYQKITLLFAFRDGLKFRIRQLPTSAPKFRFLTDSVIGIQKMGSLPVVNSHRTAVIQLSSWRCSMTVSLRRENNTKETPSYHDAPTIMLTIQHRLQNSSILMALPHLVRICSRYGCCCYDRCCPWSGGTNCILVHRCSFSAFGAMDISLLCRTWELELVCVSCPAECQ